MTSDRRPEPVEIASYLVAELGADLTKAAERYRFLLDLDADFASDSVMIPGGTTSFQAYAEARSSFVHGNYLAAVVLAQGFVENLLGGHLRIQEGVRPVHGLPPRQSGELASRPGLREILAKSVEDGLIDAEMKSRIEDLVGLRNPLLHHRDVSDSSHLMRRAMNQDTPETDLVEDDARFAIQLVVQLAYTSMEKMVPFGSGK